MVSQHIIAPMKTRLVHLGRLLILIVTFEPVELFYSSFEHMKAKNQTVRMLKTRVKKLHWFKSYDQNKQPTKMNQAHL